MFYLKATAPHLDFTNRVILTAAGHFRSSPVNGHLRAGRACLKSANRRHSTFAGTRLAATL